MILLINRATKLSATFLSLDKKYIARFKPGYITDTWDLEGYIIESRDCKDLNILKLKKIAGSLKGDFLQTPPVFSAKKINGKPAYCYARKNPYDLKIQNMKSSIVKIFDIEINSFNGDEVEMMIHCSSGTYIRSVIFEIGKILGCGATMTGLIRTDIGKFELKDCISADEVDKIAENGGPVSYEKAIIPLERLDRIMGMDKRKL